MDFMQNRVAMKVATAVVDYSILSQNGVVEGPMLYGSNSSSIDSLNGNPSPKRPGNLEVSISEYPAKTRRDESGGDDGSLPSTPASQYGEVSGCPAGDEVLESDTRQLVSRFLRDFTGTPQATRGHTKALQTMRRVVEGVLDKHRFAYNGMFNRLSLDDKGDDVTFVSSVAQSLFSDGITNWGRIASLMAFGAALCQRMKETDRDNCVELVGQEISTYLLTEQKDWLIKNNSWDGFVEFFRVPDSESTVRNALVALVGITGIGATLAFFCR